MKNMDTLTQSILEYSRAGKSSSEGKTIKVDALISGILDIIVVGNDEDVKIKFDR